MVRYPHVAAEASEKGWFYKGKMKDFSGGTIPGPDGWPCLSRIGRPGPQK